LLRNSRQSPATTLKSEAADAQELIALTALCEVLGLAALSRDLATAAIFSGIKCRRVAVVGLVKRGKSTLVNTIVGEELSPVNFLPETASVLCFARSSKALAHGITFQGKSKNLSTKPSSFAADVSREARKPLLAATYQGDLTLPDGVCLVDTPGAYESDVTAMSLRSSGMPRSLHTLCDGFIVVMGVPGVSSVDLQLLKSLNESVSPTAVRLVLKGLDSSISHSELKDYADDVLSSVFNEKYIVADNDRRELTALIQSFPATSHPGGESDAYFNPSNRSKQVTDSVKQQLLSVLRGRDKREEFDFPQQLLRDLPTEIEILVRSFARGEFNRRQAEQEKEALKAQKAARKAQGEQWEAQNYRLNQSVQTARGSLQSAEKALSSAQPSVGCGGWIFFGLSCFAFPVGPIIVGAILWYAYSKEEDELAARRPGLVSDIERAREALDRATRLHAEHQRDKPT